MNSESSLKGAPLPEAQLEVMQVIWDKGGAVMFGELSEELAMRGKKWKANTILTLLSRLSEREVLLVRKQGRLNEYIAQITREEYQQTQACALVDQVFGGDARHLISALARQDYLTERDYQELQEFWAKGGGRT